MSDAPGKALLSSGRRAYDIDMQRVLYFGFVFVSRLCAFSVFPLILFPIVFFVSCFVDFMEGIQNDRIIVVLVTAAVSHLSSLINH